jgi:phospholipid/cholesterol/gamma-HCH transport system ATP-binding protein
LGLLFQNGALFDSFNVEENVAFPLVEKGVRDAAELRQRVRAALESVGMADHLNKMPIHLSGGQRKRVALARAIITQPRCLLYDEPTAGLDPIGTANIDRLIRGFQERFQVTSLVITHDLMTVERIADRVAFLRAGRMHFLGTPREFFASTDPVLRQFLDGRPDERTND